MADNSIELYGDSLLVQRPQAADRLVMVNPGTGKPEATIRFEDLQKSLAVDYTSLSEQVVSGEKAIGWNGNPAKVYTRTIRMTAASAGSTQIMSLAGSFSMLLDAFGSAVSYPAVIDLSDVFFSAWNAGGTTVIHLAEGAVAAGKEFCITLKYTKI